MNKKIIFICAISLLLIFTLSFAVAEKNNLKYSDLNNSPNKIQKMNYGLCVSNLTKEKNECFKEAQGEYKVCESSIRNLTKSLKENNQTINKTEIKNLRENCSSNFKKELTICKENFKQQKEFCRQFKCKENELFLNNTCVKECERNEVYFNNTCLPILHNCHGKEILINNTCVRVR